jgi:SET domain-containing protein
MTKLKQKLEMQLKRWLTPKATSYQSPKHGLGIKAIQEIKKGEDVLVYGGLIIHSDETAEYWSLMGHIGTQIDNDFFIVPANREEIKSTGTINHSCEPNTGFKEQIQLVAIKDIQAGEEITLDYAFCESTHPMNFTCSCKSENCRGSITNNDWMIPDLQKRYGKFFSPYLRKRFEKNISQA